MKKILHSLNNLSQFILLSFSLTLLLLLIFFFQTGSPDNIIGILYTVSIPLYYYIILLLIMMILLPFSLLLYLRYLVIIPKILLDIFLLTDAFVFRIYRFHIDMMFIDMAIHDFSGIGLSPTAILLIIIAFFLVIAFNIWLFRMAQQKAIFKVKKINITLLIIFLLGQIIHIWAYEYSQQFITKYTPYFPYYLPTTSHSTMTKLKNKYPNLIPNPIENHTKNNKVLFDKKEVNGNFNYPINPITINDSITKYNILFFLTESWRFDMLNTKIAPNISKLASSSYQYKNHYSGGSVTVSGLFSLMYGLHPSYLKYAQSNPYKYQSIFTTILAEIGYDIAAYTPTNLDRFSLKPMFFGKISATNFINQRDLSTTENDRYIVSKLIEDIQNNNTTAPWFKFVFLNSSHHSYNYPKENEIFTPLPKNSEGFVFNKDIDPNPFLNDYKNSINYIDALFGEIYTSLEQAGVTKNTIIVITSDHGEEFNDNRAGYWGHGSNFTSYQTSVPLIIKLPHNNQHIEIDKLSGHVDIVPSILSQILECEKEITDFSSGKNLFNLPSNRGLIMSSYKDNAYLIDNKIYSNGLFFKSYDVHDVKNENKKISYDKINLLRKEETHFLKLN